jgi:hypothetical protein
VLLAATVTVGAVVAAMMVNPTPTRASIEIVSSPKGAEVRLDGTAIPQTTPLVITDVDPTQAHHLSVALRNYESWETDVRFEGRNRQVRLQAVLVPIVGAVELSSIPPGAEAIVNGRIRGVTPATVGDLPPNEEVVVELRLRGYKVAHRTFSFGQKRKLEISIPLEKAK